jgi:hypothetical protein
MAQADTPLDEAGDEEVQYDLAGNPLPPKPKAAPLPAAAPPPGGFLAAPSFAPPPAYTPPSGFTPPGAAPLPGQTPGWGGPAVKSAPSGAALYGGLALAALVLIALIFVVRALRPVTVTAPTAYKTYTAIDNTFSCDQPVGWTLHETGATAGALSTVTFEKAHVRVRVISDSIGSLVADTMTSNTSTETLPGMPPPPPPKPAVEKLHEMDKAQLADSLPGYKEGEMQNLESRVGDARISEWSADGGKMHGYRVTMLGNQREMTVICISPERNWAILQPAFQRMIASVVPGNG